MNLIPGTLIDLVMSAAETMREEMIQALSKYREGASVARRVADKYKPEIAEEYYREEREKLASSCRNGIEKAEKAFQSRIESLSGKMETELKRHLSEPVNGEFHSKLKLIQDFGLQPERLELENLLSLNNGNPMGLQALAKVLKKNGSAYRLNYHTTGDFQQDLEKIRSLCQNLKYCPAGFMPEMVEVYQGITGNYVYPNGNTLFGSVIYDRNTLAVKTAFFEERLNQIKAMRDVWSADCSYTEADRQAEAETEVQREVNRILTESGLESKPITEPKSETAVSEATEAGMQFARELSQQSARNAKIYNQAMEMYSK